MASGVNTARNFASDTDSAPSESSALNTSVSCECEYGYGEVGHADIAVSEARSVSEYLGMSETFQQGRVSNCETGCREAQRSKSNN